MNFRSWADELVKLGAISDEQANSALERLDAIEKSKPTLGQVGRYGAIGAGTGVAARALGSAIEGGLPMNGRGALAAGVTGALMGGAVPMLRTHFDRGAEVGTLKKYLGQQHELPSTVMPAGIDTPPDTPPKVAMDASLMGSLKGVAGAGPKMALKRGIDQFSARGLNAEAHGALASSPGLLGGPKKLPFGAIAVEKDPFAKAAASEKDSGFMDSLKSALTTPIPGTPDLLIKSEGMAKNLGKSAPKPGDAFKKWQATQAAKHAAAAVTVTQPGATPAPAAQPAAGTPPAPMMQAPYKPPPGVSFAPKPRYAT